MIDFVQLAAFFLVFTRITSFMASSPFFSMSNIPGMVKVGLSFILTVVVFPTVAAGGLTYSGTMFEYVLAVAAEVMVGLLMGLAASFIFYSIRMAGELMDFQIGFSMANVFDPLSGAQVTLLGHFMFLLGLMVFLNIDGHHSLIRSLTESYQLVPLTAVQVDGGTINAAARIFSGMFAIALKVSVPLIATLVITDVVMGFVGRTAPQMNIFMVAFPLKIALGILILSLLIPVLIPVFKEIFIQMQKDLILIMRGLT